MVVALRGRLSTCCNPVGRGVQQVVDGSGRYQSRTRLPQPRAVAAGSGRSCRRPRRPPRRAPSRRRRRPGPSPGPPGTCRVPRARPTHPVEDVGSSSVDAELQRSCAACRRCAPPTGASASARAHGYLVQASSVARVRLRPTLRPGASKVLDSRRVSDAQGLGVALEPATGLAELVQHPLAVVPERRVPEVVGEGRRLGEVGVAAQRSGQVTGHLRHLEAVGQAVAHEVVGLGTRSPGSWPRDAGSGRVHHSRAVPLEGPTHRARRHAWGARGRGARGRGRRRGAPSGATLPGAPTAPRPARGSAASRGALTSTAR